MYTFLEAREILLRAVSPVAAQTIPLEQCVERVLAEDVTAVMDVPGFDRSAFDGYALRAEDTALAGTDHPVSLPVIAALHAGSAPDLTIPPGTAARVMTGSPIPVGADAVVMFEKTLEEPDRISLFAPLRCWENVIRVGEDVRKGAHLLRAGAVLDAGALGLLAAQGLERAPVFRVPLVGIISTGSELTEACLPLAPGKIYDANRYSLSAALTRLGCRPLFLGQVEDDTARIAEKLRQALPICDALILTGGVSVGDRDLTPAAMAAAGAELLVRGAAMKPGKACAYGRKDGKLLCALSGNPAAALTNFHALAAPALRRLCGRESCLPKQIRLTLADAFPKPSPQTRLLRGRLDLADGRVRFRLPAGQGNSVLSSAVGCDAMAVIPAGSGPLSAGTELQGFLL